MGPNARLINIAFFTGLNSLNSQRNSKRSLQNNCTGNNSQTWKKYLQSEGNHRSSQNQILPLLAQEKAFGFSKWWLGSTSQIFGEVADLAWGEVGSWRRTIGNC